MSIWLRKFPEDFRVVILLVKNKCGRKIDCELYKLGFR